MLAILTESFALLACYMALMIFRRGERAQYAHAIHWGRIWSRAVCRLIGLRVKVEGTPPVPGSLIVPNHTGYLDVLAVCSAAGCFFVPKSEVGGWPVIGSFIRLARHPLVKRAKSRAMKATADEITARLRCGQSVCVFLEGTSTGGDRVLPFQSSFIQPAIDSGSPIVPAAIRWIPSNPKISVSEDIAYWRDEHTFIPHLWRLLGVNRIEALIRFGEPISTQARERKGIATEARAETLRLLQPDPL
ncbi:1-acyl-sn-glycerol-3-phosphate acyltransferase [Candidatus Sumerlaeota bacterium]|nr:1-acyl-sn-glycerol-3-phosphate acyltransferase [Candidatus Sumerlaeota bacterium]